MAATPDLDTGPKLEARSGITTSTLSRWLKDEPESAATLDALQAIAKAFGIQPWELLVDEKVSDRYLVDRLLRRR